MLTVKLEKFFSMPTAYLTLILRQMYGVVLAPTKKTIYEIVAQKSYKKILFPDLSLTTDEKQNQLV
jgi:hypothetical protein